MRRTTNPTETRALAAFRRLGGTLRTTGAVAAGIHPRVLYRLRDDGRLEQLARGVFRLVGPTSSGDPDLAAVAIRIPRGVVCLVSALSLHGLTTQIPRKIDIALPPGGSTPILEHPPVRIYRFSPASVSSGITTKLVGGTRVRVFTPEKSIADCFKFRNKIGIDVGIEALRNYLSLRTKNVDQLLRYAEIDRVGSVIRPYVEALLG